VSPMGGGMVTLAFDKVSPSHRGRHCHTSGGGRRGAPCSGGGGLWCEAGLEGGQLEA
jgi:hypothetical protein